jgi:hypothetical protein
MFIQKNILKYLIKIKENEADNLESDHATVRLFEYLKKNEKNIAHYRELKHHLVDFVASDYIKNKSIAKGILLSFHRRDSASILTEGNRESYHLLLGIGKSEDYENVLKIVYKSPQNRNFFEKFLFQSGMGYYGEYRKSYYVDRYREQPLEVFYTKEQMDSLWQRTMQIDTCRILDYKGMYYLNREDFANAYATYSRVPNNYWENYPYKFYVNNPFNGGKHCKTDYLKGMIDAEKALDTATVTKGFLYSQLAHAHYNMSYDGDSWLMREIGQCDYVYSINHANREEYIDNKKAFFYFKKAYESATDDEMKSSIAYQLEKLYNRKRNEATFWRNQPHEIGRNCGIELDYLRWQNHK